MEFSLVLTIVVSIESYGDLGIPHFGALPQGSLLGQGVLGIACAIVGTALLLLWRRRKANLSTSGSRPLLDDLFLVWLVLCWLVGWLDDF